jgi:hypothetical protein
MPGPVPKRSEERIRRNKDETPIVVLHASGSVNIPELDLPEPHPITAQLWDSAVNSAQGKYYEESDWAYLRFTLHFVDDLVKSSRPNGQVLATVHSMMSDLLVTEGSRRKVRIEVERSEVQAKVTDIAELFRQRLAK